MGSKALAIPLDLYYGSWVIDDSNKDKDGSLLEICNYLIEIKLPHLKLDQFKKDIDAGLYFKSNIPIGYGVGSSGALCAGILDRYKTDEVKTYSVEQLRKHLGLIESCFHGTSSGLDPLVSYLNKPILIDPSKPIEVLDKVSIPEGLYVYLLDSGVPRKTDLLVRQFKEKAELPAFKAFFELDYIPLVNKIIDSWLAGDVKVLKDIKSLSELQFENFKEYIPKNIFKEWEDILIEDDSAIKLCGAGGGGFFLVFSSNENLEIKGISLIKIT